MPVNIAFYVHHHGSGHIMRCIAISQHLPTDCKITFLGSNLQAYCAVIPAHVSCIHLPMDTAIDSDYAFTNEDQPAGLHYAPLNITGQRERVGLMAGFFARTPQMLLVVDVSVEVAMLARLSGVPFVVMRQHGNRNDLPHLHAYHNASALIAPYPETFSQHEPNWLQTKTFYMGGYSRFGKKHVSRENTVCINHAVVLVGSGGTSIDGQFIEHLATECPKWHFDVIGKINMSSDIKYTNLVCHGSLNDPLPFLRKSQVIIGNTGHNTVMEAASLEKPFITIPEHRPFDEQVVKADILQKLNMATVVVPDRLYNVNWPLLLMAAPDLANWQGVINPQALEQAAHKLVSIHNEMFCENNANAMA